MKYICPKNLRESRNALGPSGGHSPNSRGPLCGCPPFQGTLVPKFSDFTPAPVIVKLELMSSLSDNVAALLTRVKESTEHMEIVCWAGKNNGIALLGNSNFRIQKNISLHSLYRVGHLVF